MTAFIPVGKKDIFEVNLEFDLKVSGNDLIAIILKHYEPIFKKAGFELNID